MKTCECYINKMDENAPCYSAPHAIVYCPTHLAADRMREFINSIATGYHTEVNREKEAKAILKEFDKKEPSK